jgi:hypothetical protein
MSRTFGFDVLACRRWGGRLRLIALIEEAAVTERVLGHIGAPTEIPAPRPARAPPLRLGTPDQVGKDDDAPMFDPYSWGSSARPAVSAPEVSLSPNHAPREALREGTRHRCNP